MKIAVIVSQVPDTTTKIVIAADGKSIDESNITWILNPYSEFAIEKALKLKEANESKVEEIILIGMGLERSVEALRQGLAMGADRAILLKSDFVNSKILASKIKELGADLVLAGKKNIDLESASAEIAVASHLDLSFVPVINKIEWNADAIRVSREVSGEQQVFDLSFPALLTCDKGNDEPRYASIMGIMKAKKKPLDIIEINAQDDLGLELVEVSLPAPRSACKIMEGSAEEASEKLLRALREEAKVL